MKTLIIGGVAALAFGGLALAQEGGLGPRPGDANGDGRVSQAEFLAASAERFARGDANGDGTVTPEEMRTAMAARGAEFRGEIFTRLDANGDGSISRAEFDQGAAMRPEGRGGPGHRGGHGRGHGRPGGEDFAMGGDGVTAAEAQARATAMFSRMDTNGDGYLSADDRTGERRWGPQGSVSE